MMLTFKKSLSSRLIVACLITLAAKYFLAALIPITGDETYYHLLATHVDFYFVEHPAMMGWVVWLLERFGDNKVWLRSWPILVSQLAGLVLYLIIRKYEKDIAVWAAVFYWLSPINMFNIILANDTALFLWSFLAIFCLCRQYHIAVGVCLGLAFLTKYFAVLLLFAVTVYLLYQKACKPIFKIYLAAIPFIAINLFGNYYYGWTNIAFNLFSRNTDIGIQNFSHTFPLYVITQISLMLSPIAVYAALRLRRQEKLQVFSRLSVISSVTFVLPMILFTIMAMTRNVGVHWTLGFMFSWFLWLSLNVRPDKFVSLIKKQAIYTMILFVFVALTALLLYGGIFDETKVYRENSILLNADKDLKPILTTYADNGWLFATESYSKACILYYQTGYFFSMWGIGSYHGRQDDFTTDWQKYSGKNIAIIKWDNPSEEEFRPYFKDIKTIKLSVSGAPLYMVLGYDFNYDLYRKNVLSVIYNSFYKLPPWLPVPYHKFRDKYNL